jgi:protein SCO1/2
VNMYKLSVYLIPLFFSSCDFPVRKNLDDLLPQNQIRARVLVVDTNSSMVRAEVLACGEFLSKKWGGFSGFEKDFAVQPGALNLLSHTNVFRASARETFTPAKGEGFLLTGVWPDDRAERIRVNNVNRLLRRDTLSMGDSMIRSVGDTLPPFALYDQDGRIITTDYFDGSVTVLNFIFTRCSIPEMCPASTMRMKKLQTLAKQTKVPFVRFLSITLDPEFDTPGVLKSYARAYSLDEGNFRLGTANKAVIDDLTRQFGIFRKNVEDLPLDHTMRTMIINSKRQIIYQFPGSQWSVEDFLSRLPEGIEGESVQ